MVEDVVPDEEFNAIVLDMPVHSPAIAACAPKLAFGEDLRVMHLLLPNSRLLEILQRIWLIVEWAGGHGKAVGINLKGRNETCKWTIWTHFPFLHKEMIIPQLILFHILDR